MSKGGSSMKKEETLWVWSLPPDVPYKHIQMFVVNADKNWLTRKILKLIAKPVPIVYMSVSTAKTKRRKNNE